MRVPPFSKPNELAVILYARRVPGRRASWVETAAALLGAIRNPAHVVSPSHRLFSWLDRNSYDNLSYANDWLAAFRDSPLLEAHAYNIVNLLEARKAQRQLVAAPLVVILHSALGDDVGTISRLLSALQNRRGKLLLFIGNEYTHMREKIAFAQQAQADYIASQLPIESARWLYAHCENTTVLAAPAALNPNRYYPGEGPRDIDIGFRGDRYPLWLGDAERSEVIEALQYRVEAMNLVADIQFQRVAAPEWQMFLNRCKGIVGAEAGTYFLERDDRAARSACAHLQRYPETTIANLRQTFFSNLSNYVSGKAISSRHFEAIGTKTAQLLLEGGYNGILESDIHYFAIRRDLSNMDEILSRFQDEKERAQIVDTAYSLAMSEHTYSHRVNGLLTAMGLL